MFEKIEFELQQNIDKHSKTLILDTIQLILNYSLRFYDRQFITRERIHEGFLPVFYQTVSLILIDLAMSNGYYLSIYQFYRY